MVSDWSSFYIHCSGFFCEQTLFNTFHVYIYSLAFSAPGESRTCSNLIFHCSTS